MKTILLALIGVLFGCNPHEESSGLNFNFGERASGNFIVNSNATWPTTKDSIKFGLFGSAYQVEDAFVTSADPFSFWVEVPEGNYTISVVVGDEQSSSNTTIKAESRRLMVYDHTTAAGAIDTLEFAVSVRSARINDQDSIRLKSREFEYLNWDKYLNLEFGGDSPKVRAVMIEPADSIPTIFLTGNSTVVDQDKDPWASWGQFFTLFLKKDVVVANYAESGLTLKAFIGQKRLDKIATQIKPGDYLFMEFAHNDQKPGGSHVEPYSSYQEYLMKFVQLARENGATPVMVTSTNRRKFEDGVIVNTLEEYPQAMRDLAQEEGILLIDLNAMTKTFYEALGEEDSKRAFVHYDALTFPWQKEALADNTHFSTYGAWQLAKCVVTGIQASDSPLRDYIKASWTEYDPASPDNYETWKWPISKMSFSSKPDGY